MRILLIYSILLTTLFIGCVETPSNPSVKGFDYEKLPVPFPISGAVILCEGLWNYNNSDIYIYNEDSEEIGKAYFKKATGEYLGDIVSDMFLLDEKRILFTATGTNQLLLLDYSIPAIASRINIGYERAAPRSITNIGNKYYYTDLYRDEVRSGSIGDTLTEPSVVYETGPAPEDIIAQNGKLYIANSGFGDYRQAENRAGTLQILDPSTGKSEFIFIGPNLVNLSINKSENYLACGYLNTPSEVDKGEAGGIKFVDLGTNIIIREMNLQDFSDVELNESTGRIYYLAKGGLYMLSSIYSKALPQLIFENDSKDIWSSLSIDEKRNEIWVGNSSNYQSDGEIIVFSETGTIIRTLKVGKNPRKVVFY